MPTETALLLAIPACVASVGLSLAFARSWKLGIFAIAATYAAEGALAGLPGVDIGLVIVYPQDWLFACLAAASGLNKRYRGATAVLILIALTLLQFVRGTFEFSLKQSGVDLRPVFYFLAALHYTASRKIYSEAALEFVAKCLRWAAAILLATAVFRWGMLGLGSPLTVLWEPISGAFPLRVLNAAQTLLIFQAVVLALAQKTATKGDKPTNAVLVGVALGAVVLLQHRTVWVVSIVTALTLWFLYSDALRAVGRRAVLPLLATAFVALIVATMQFSQLSTSLANSVNSAFSEESTFKWRIEVWQSVLAADTERRPFEYVIGQPFGSRYSGVRNALEVDDVDKSPHNLYVQTFARMGLAGLVALLTLYVTALRSGRNSQSSAFTLQQALSVLMIGQLVYALSYSPDYAQALVVGTALAMVGARKASPRRVGPEATHRRHVRVAAPAVVTTAARSSAR